MIEEKSRTEARCRGTNLSAGARMGRARLGVDWLSEPRRSLAGRSRTRARGGRGLRPRRVGGGQGRAGAAGRGRSRFRSKPRGRSTGPHIEVVVEPFGDIWLRDTGADRPRPRCARRPARDSASTAGAANMSCEGDDTIGASPRRAAPICDAVRHDWVFEGGAIDVDGTRPRRHHRAMPAQPEPQSGPDPRGCRGAAARRSRPRPRVLAGRRPAQRPYRRPCRQSRSLRRRRAGSLCPRRGR